jgi:hypothetical protein
MHLVQLNRKEHRAVAVVDDGNLRLLANYRFVYELAMDAIRRNIPLTGLAKQNLSGVTLDYAAIHAGDSDWRLLCPVDHPGDPARVMVSGTGLTHKVSAENRAAMHRGASPTITDSMRMYQLGKAGGFIPSGEIGVQPEWFYKGNGSILRAHGESLLTPSYGSDGGEEAEIAAAYLIDEAGQPRRLGFMIGNEFSDHVMEKENYLYLAHSKLRNCAIGPELVVTDKDFFLDLTGKVVIRRKDGTKIWEAMAYSGEKNMCHSLANLEHHHFKYEAHRRPEDLHIHFFGADAFSFGDGVRLQDEDSVEICFSALGWPLKNTVRIAPCEQKPVSISALG